MEQDASIRSRDKSGQLAGSDVWRLLRTEAADGAWNMALDEAILEHVEAGEAPPTLRLYAWTPPCLSLGRAQPFKDVDLDRLRERGWGVVRRLTGGRAILHADELTYSVIGRADDPRLSGTVVESYSRLALALGAGLRGMGLPIELSAQRASAEDRRNPVCFEVPSVHEITVAGRKLVGSAQARRRRGVLQHGSLPLQGDLRRICEVLRFSDEAAREAAADRLRRSAITVEQALGTAFSWEGAADAIQRGFSDVLGLRLEAEEPSAGELQRAHELVKVKYVHPTWTERV